MTRYSSFSPNQPINLVFDPVQPLLDGLDENVRIDVVNAVMKVYLMLHLAMLRMRSHRGCADIRMFGWVREDGFVISYVLKDDVMIVTEISFDDPWFPDPDGTGAVGVFDVRWAGRKRLLKSRPIARAALARADAVPAGATLAAGMQALRHENTVSAAMAAATAKAKDAPVCRKVLWETPPRTLRMLLHHATSQSRIAERRQQQRTGMALHVQMHRRRAGAGDRMLAAQALLVRVEILNALLARIRFGRTAAKAKPNAMLFREIALSFAERYRDLKAIEMAARPRGRRRLAHGTAAGRMPQLGAAIGGHARMTGLQALPGGSRTLRKIELALAAWLAREAFAIATSRADGTHDDVDPLAIFRRQGVAALFRFGATDGVYDDLDTVFAIELMPERR